MRSPKQSSAEMRTRSLFIVLLAFAGIFGSSADQTHSVAAAAVAGEAPTDQQHKDLLERYLQAISEQDGAETAVVGASEGNETCFAGWDTSCQDNPSFLSVMGASCRMHQGFDCTMLHAIGYDEHEVYDVIHNCPCSCEVPCGQWTVTPSAAPSSSPSSTPSASPSSSPTASPSAAPSRSPQPSSPPTSTPTAAPSISLSPTQNKSIGVGNSGMVGGILAAFAGVSGVIALAYCGAKRGRFNKPWGEAVFSFGSKEDALTTEEYNNGHQFSKAKKTSLNDLERGNAGTETFPSAIDQLYSKSQESAGSFHFPMMVEDRIEMVEVPALEIATSQGSVGDSFDVQLSSANSELLIDDDLEKITEVSISDSNSVDENFSSDKYRMRRRRSAQRTPPRPNGNRISGCDRIVRSAPRNGRPPLFASPSIQRSESIGRMTMLSTPQSVDSEGSIELVLPHEGSI